MAADIPPHQPPTGCPPAPAVSVPDQSRRRVPPADRTIRQVQAVDAWIAACRKRELVLQGPHLTRDERMDVVRELEWLRRTRDAITGCSARALDAELEPMRRPGRTAVIAHRHVWFVDKVALLLRGHGVDVLLCTDNGAEALGVVVAEQPDMAIVGDRLAMMSGPAFLGEARLYSPSTLLAVQTSEQERADALRADPDLVFLRHHPPAVVADALVALHLMTTFELSSA